MMYPSSSDSVTRGQYVAPLPSKTYHETEAKGLGGEYGYFIFETDEEHPEFGVNVIGKASSIDAAFRLYEIIARTA